MEKEKYTDEQLLQFLVMKNAINKEARRMGRNSEYPKVIPIPSDLVDRVMKNREMQNKQDSSIIKI